MKGANKMQKEEESKQKISPFKKYKVGIAAIMLIIIAAFGVLYIHRHEKTKKADDNTTSNNSYTVRWQGKKYKGTYIGKKKKGKPSGKGTFESKDGDFVYEGQWTAGKFDGSGKISYGDGSYEEGKYDSGKRYGLITAYTSESEYSEATYSNNKIYGVKIYYKNGEELRREYYVQGKSVDSIKNDSFKLTKISLNEKTYVDNCIFVEGEVVYSGDDEKKTYFRIKTDSVGMVTGEYNNSIARKEKQACLPNLEVGDNVRIYGYYKGVYNNNNISDAEGYGYDAIKITPIYGCLIDEENSNYGNLNYSEMLKYPYDNYRLSMEATFDVIDIFQDSSYIFLKAVKKESADDDTTNKKSKKKKSQEIYMLMYKIEDEVTVFKKEEITIKGYYYGQYKEVTEEDRQSLLDYKNSGSSYIRTFDFERYPAIRFSSWN